MEHNRRSFLTGAAFAALSQSRVLGANDRVRLGAIGTGGRSRELLHAAQVAGGNEIVAVCDVYAPRRAEKIEKFAPGGKEYVDYKELLDRKDIDAVVIASPDHWHVPMALDSVAAGKDVYVEKPVTHTIDEGEKLIAGVRASNRIVQCGMQQRSWEHFATAVEMIQGGKLGKVTQVRTYWFQNYGRRNPPPVDTALLDWKRWLGSAPQQPFEPDRFLTWRWYWDFGGGAMTDLFTHWVDVVHWAMREDMPKTGQMTGSKYRFPQRDCPDTLDAAFEYPGFLVSYDGTMVSSVDDGGLEFRGTGATMKLNRGHLRVFEEGKRGAQPQFEVLSKEDGTIAHMRNFLDCVRSRKQPNAPVETGVAAARAGHLGNMAFRSSGQWRAGAA